MRPRKGEESPRSRRPESSPSSPTASYSKQSNAKASSSRRGTAAAVVATTFTAALTNKPEGDPVVMKQDRAARKLQAVFKAWFASRLRAEAKLLDLLRAARGELTNHWPTK